MTDKSVEPSCVSSVVVLSTADFDSHVWTNKQHLAMRLAEVEDVEVAYINSLGLRSPRLNTSDARRIVRRATGLLRRRPRPSAQRSPRTDRLRVVSPRVVPFHGSKLFRAVNRVTFARQVRSLLDTMAPGSHKVLWTFSPTTYGVERYFDAVVYHSVDLLHELPGVPARALLADERTLLNDADAVIASSAGVSEHLLASGASDVTVFRNVADVSRYVDAVTRRTGKRDIDALFAGNLTPSKIDIHLLRSIAEKGISIVVAGPADIDGSRSAEIRELFELPNVEYVGNLDREGLADTAARAKVGLIPYLLNGYTTGVFPMKVFEYLAAGSIVVSTPLPSLFADQPSGLTVLEADEGFAEFVRHAVESFDENEASARSEAARPYSWDVRMTEVQALLGRLAERR